MTTTARPNPILPGFNPDPSVVAVDGAYFLVTSTFEYLPGLPVYRSTDLIEWARIGHVITRPEQVGIEHVPAPGGVWAPTIRYRDGVFYLIVTVMLAPRGCVVFTAADPAGPWSDGLPLPAVDGIDPDLAWDDDGVACVTYAKFGTGILQQGVDLATGEALEPARLLWSGTGLRAPEGPHLYRRGDGDWYLLIAEGGTERGHAVSIARGPSPRGPFAGAPTNPVLTARSTGNPVQNVGHGDLVETPSGGTAMVHLGVRPLGFAQAFSPLGRETFLTDVAWVDGWPVVDMVTVGPHVGSSDVRTFDGGTAVTLDDEWIAVRRMPSSVASIRDGRLRVDSGGRDLSDPAPAFIGRRQAAMSATVSARVDVREGAGGIAGRQSDDAWFAIEAREVATRTQITARAAVSSLQQTWTQEFLHGEVELFIGIEAPSSTIPGPQSADRITLGARVDGEEHVLARLDGRHWSFETSGSFTGRVVGVYASEGSVDFTEFTYTD